jgi:quercetin dioxygenase-like cupin family protein
MKDITHAALFQVDPEPTSAASAPNSILSQALLVNADLKAVRFVFARGQELSEHTATVAALIHQVSGKARWTMGDESREALPGDWAYLPPNLKHSITALEDSVMLLILLRRCTPAPDET